MVFRQLTIFAVAFSIVAAIAAPSAAAMTTSDNEPDALPASVVAVTCNAGTVTVDGNATDVTCDGTGTLELRTAPSIDTIVLDGPTIGTLDVRAPGSLTVTGSVEAETIRVEAGDLQVTGTMTAETIALSSPSQLSVSASLTAAASIDLFAAVVGIALHPTSVIDAPVVTIRGGNVSAAGAIRGDTVTLTSPASGETIVTGDITAPGGHIVIDGGAVGILGADADIGAGAVVDAAGEFGGGRIAIGDSAASTLVGADTLITADATFEGDGGTIRIWSDDTTTSFGTITARGGPRGGSGGQVEVSGRRASNAYGDIDVTGIDGPDGEVLLDPLTFMLLPQGVLLQVTAIDDLDAVSFKASPSPILDSGAFVGQYFCDLVGIASCGTPTSPSLTDYRLRYWSTNTIIGLLTGPLNPSKQLRDRFKPLRVRGSVTFLQPATLESFEGDIQLEAVFGITLLHGLIDGDELYDAVGIPLDWIPQPFTPDGELQLDNQGPGDTFSAATPFTIVSIGDITTAGGDVTFDAGVNIPADEIQAWIEQMVDETGEFSLADLAAMRVEDMIAAAVADAAGNDDIQAMVDDLTAMANLLCGNCVPDLVEPLGNVIVPADGTSYTLANVTAIPPLLDALGVTVPAWVDDLTDTLDEIDTYASWIPSGTDLVDAALGGISIDVLGLPGDVTTVCWGIESGGKCYSLVDPPIAGVPGEVTSVCVDWNWLPPYQCFDYDDVCNLGLGTWSGGECWTIPPHDGTEIGYDTECNLGTGFWQDGECWTIPPGTVTIPGLHDADPSIPPSFASLISETLAPLIADGIADLIDSASIAAGLGPVPDSFQLPPLSLADRTGGALLYVAGDVDARSGTVTLSNASTGLIAIADTISGDRIVVDGPDAALRNARYDLGTVLSLAGVDQDLVGDTGSAVLQADEIVIATGDGIGTDAAPITLRPTGTDLDLTVFDTGDGIRLRFDRNGTVAGTIDGAATARIEIDADTDLGAIDADLPSDQNLDVRLDGTVTLPGTISAAAVNVTGDAGDDTARTGLYPTVPVDIDGGAGTDTLALQLGDVTPVQDTYGSLLVDGTAGLTYRDIEWITGLAPTVLTPVAPVTVPEGSEWPLLARWIDWGAASWTVAADWGDGTDQAVVRDRSASEADTRIVETTVTRTFTDDGVRTVALAVTDNQDGIGASTTLHVEVTNVAPTVSAPDAQRIAEGDAAQVAATFTDPGGDDTHTAAIDWGDGTSTDPTVLETTGATDGSVTGTHVYADDGTYTVQICVTDDDGATGCDTTTIDVTNRVPTVDAGGDRSLAEGDLWSLDPAVFHDAGTADTHVASVDWGDGTIDAATVTEAPFGPPGDVVGAGGAVDAGHVYADDGTYGVQVCVTDDDGAGSCDTLEAQVANVLPVVGVPSGSGDEGAVVGFDAAIRDAGIADVLTGTVDWGDGTPPVDAELSAGTAPGNWTPTATHVYADDGTYTITLCVTDDDAPDVPVCTAGSATIDNVAPALEPVQPVTGVEGHPVTATVPFTDPGSGDTFTATVDWGDGTTAELADATIDDGTGSVALPAHVFVENGTYTATVCVQDDDGAEACVGVAFEIANAVPIVSVRPAAGVEGASTVLAGVTSDDGADDHLVVTVDWGDGAVDRFDVPGHGGRRIGPEHIYADDGTYPIEVCVVDDDTDATCATTDATIANAEPQVQIGRPGSVVEGDETTIRILIDDQGPVDVHTVTVHWGDGTADVLPGDAGDAVAAVHRYRAPGRATVVVCVDDGDDTVCRTFDLDVDNAPVVVETGPFSVGTAGSVSMLEAFSVLDGGLPTDVTVDWGDGTPAETLAAGATPAHVFDDPGRYEVEVCASDDDGTPACETTVVEIAPQIVTSGVEIPGDDSLAPTWMWLLVLVASLLGAGIAALRLRNGD